jgi:hypothetical protein
MEVVVRAGYESSKVALRDLEGLRILEVKGGAKLLRVGKSDGEGSA